MASHSPLLIPGSVNTAASLPGSRSRGGTTSSSNTTISSSGGGNSSQQPQLWGNPVALECGVLRLLLEKQKHGGAGASVGQKFPFSQLRKLLVYCRNKGKSCYPNIRFSNWLYVASTKLGVSEDLAWVYFETFDAVSEIGVRDRLQLLEITSRCSSEQELHELRKKLSVDLTQFVLFLFLQNAPRSSLKTPMLAAEEWPSPESELRQKSAEHYHLMFLRTNLQALLQLVQDTEDGLQLSEEAVKALGFVFSTAGAKSSPRECTLLDLAVSASTHSGYSKISKSFSLVQFEFWVRSLLGVNPCGPSSLLSQRRDLQPAVCFRSDGSGRLLTNPNTPIKHRASLLYRINKQTLASCSENLHHSSVHIRNCRRSNIYLLAPMKAVHVEKCSRCVLVLGAVSSAVTISNSDSLTVITACRKMHISGSTTCVLHLLSMTRPLLLPGSLHITLAPYNTHYPMLRDHLHLVGLSPVTNYWDFPVDLTGGVVGTGSTAPTWELMPPELFRPMEIPFDLPGPTEEIPCALPPSYLRALDAKRERLKQWYDLIAKTRLNAEQNKRLWTTARDHFDEWLVGEGHKKELLDLGLKFVPSLMNSQQACAPKDEHFKSTVMNKPAR